MQQPRRDHADNGVMPSFLAAALNAPSESRFALTVERSGRVAVPSLEVAIESASRKKGLLGREALEDGSGLLIAPTNAVHTFFMRFTIDIVFVARAGEIVKIRRGVPAWRIAAAWRGFAVVELAAGGAERAGLDVGERVKVRAL